MNRDEFKASPARGRWALAMPVATVLWLAAGLVPSAAQMSADAVFSDFKPNGEFLFDLDGKTLDHAEIYLSDRAAAYLVIAPELSSPLLISPRTQSVESVSFMKVAKREDGTIDLLADASFNRLGGFRIANHEVIFQVKGQQARLRAKPPLLGEHHAETLRAYKPEYGRLADEYAPTAPAVAALRAQGREVRVRVYFGTWCPVCGRLVPRIIKVAESLEGSKVSFEYHGLPQPMNDDPETERFGIHGVPTAIVYVGDKEIGRLSGGDLDAPEKAISKLVNGAKS